MTDGQAQVRRAADADLPAILGIDPLAARCDQERADLLTRSVARAECWLYLDGDEVVGFLVLRPAHFFGRDFVELLAVDPGRRRAGIGRALLREALAVAGTEYVFTSTNTSNQPMRSLLQSERWSLSGQLSGLDEGDPELVFYTASSRAARPGTQAGGLGTLNPR
jgi:ribosomal protein S18 acetylase RimI-like enzyme